MTELPSAEKDHKSRHWLLQSVGLAFGLAVLMVAVVAVVVLALESPSNRRMAGVRATPLAAAAPFDATVATVPEQTATAAPTATAEPTQTPIEKSAVAAAPDQTASEMDWLSIDGQRQRRAAQALALTPVPTVAATATPLPTVTIRTVARSSALPRASASAPSTSIERQPTATATPLRELDFSFYVKTACAQEPNRQMVTVMITAMGGVGPYDYYHDTVLLAENTNDSFKLVVKAPVGNPVPFKLIVIDSIGQRYMKEFFYHSTQHCRW